ncbi:hypothetical protein FHG87_024576 [Trinorchestia longiramus]|nr:hypothetical protein FHG87_024576 [Trinorchestia longiramus]
MPRVGRDYLNEIPKHVLTTAYISDVEDNRIQLDEGQQKISVHWNTPASDMSGAEAEVASMNSVVGEAANSAKSLAKREASDANTLNFSINTTWSGEPIDHDPITMSIQGRRDHVLWCIDAPYMGDPPPPTRPGEPLWQLWEYEVVEAFFLNDEDQYLEVELGPHGQHIVLLLYGKRNILRHSLPMQVTTTITGSRWRGTGVIPIEYFPPKVNRFNAYAMHVPGKRRHQESLYPADRKKLSEAEL